MLATLRETLNLPPAKLVVFLTVATASVQRHVRRTDLSQHASAAAAQWRPRIWG